ncbi:T-complex protein 1 subunit delta [Striga asiatica]|uniref:T-complex protein 1 subunit delta n=1 Tax=Striga asiatica TaxID=4170 RepID=A0A5A7PF55_STRAF|nr:T-complex protein 1 subunit delta [Striga asiatica]
MPTKGTDTVDAPLSQVFVEAQGSTEYEGLPRFDDEGTTEYESLPIFYEENPMALVAPVGVVATVDDDNGSINKDASITEVEILSSMAILVDFSDHESFVKSASTSLNSKGVVDNFVKEVENGTNDFYASAVVPKQDRRDNKPPIVKDRAGYNLIVADMSAMECQLNRLHKFGDASALENVVGSGRLISGHPLHPLLNLVLRTQGLCTSTVRSPAAYGRSPERSLPQVGAGGEMMVNGVYELGHLLEN